MGQQLVEAAGLEWPDRARLGRLPCQWRLLDDDTARGRGGLSADRVEDRRCGLRCEGRHAIHDGPEDRPYQGGRLELVVGGAQAPPARRSIQRAVQVRQGGLVQVAVFHVVRLHLRPDRILGSDLGDGVLARALRGGHLQCAVFLGHLPSRADDNRSSSCWRSRRRQDRELGREHEPRPGRHGWPGRPHRRGPSPQQDIHARVW
mmetsp:Transcript_49104/g.141174  ORF Transcript_49104/g.141174 Transcript_49104/m.141174 type:complete len:204 (-) Transcript_49104:1415-2026(-)